MSVVYSILVFFPQCLYRGSFLGRRYCAGRQDVMMNADQMNWYYILYLFGMISVVLGVFNLWIYRKALWQMLFSADDDEEGED